VTRRRWLLVGLAVALVAGGLAAGLALTLGDDGAGEASSEPVPSYVQAGGFVTGGSGGSSPVSATAGPGSGEPEVEPELKELLTDAYQRRAYPLDGVGLAQASAAQQSFADLPLRVPAAQAIGAVSALSVNAEWRPLGPKVATALPSPFVPRGVQARPDEVAGRVTSILLAPRCAVGNCRLWLGTAGGGVFRTDDALAAKPTWVSVSSGLTSSAIGFLARDPSDATGQTVYAGTGEPNSSQDSEAGVGVFRSTNGGTSWSLLAGSPAATAGAAVSGIVVDPRNAQTIYVATARSVHGLSSVAGGHRPPPGAARYGLYRSTDGGASFSLLSSWARTTASGDATGWVDQLALDPNDPDTLYAAVVGEGLFRRSQRIDGDTEFHRVFAFQSAESGDRSRAIFSLADRGTATRIYLGSAHGSTDPDDEEDTAHLYRIDDASQPAASMLTGWTQLSSDKADAPGFAAYRYCGEQCWYDDVVVSPSGRPDVVWLGGNFDYDQASVGATAGRAVLRSGDAGGTFNDLSSDAREPRFVMHPDVHAIAFSPDDPEVAFIGTDGGLVRTSGQYADVSSRCPSTLTDVDRASCQRLLGRVPTRIDGLNAGLDTLQLQSVSINRSPGSPELLAGTQDNGTWSYSQADGWRNIATGDGGQSGVDVKNPQIGFHTYFLTWVRINFSGFDPAKWKRIEEMLAASRERVGFYMPIILDPARSGVLFAGLQHVWRTDGCVSESSTACGVWVPLGKDLTGTDFGSDRTGANPRKNFIAAVERAPSDSSTLWAATLPGRVFVSKNADAAPAEAVEFTRIDHPRGVAGTLSTPERFVSGIAIDPQDPNHAWISYSGYDAYTPEDEAGHVFEVKYDPAVKTATWTNRSYNLGDEPITDIARDPTTGDLYASTDFGVTRLPAGATAWTEAAKGLPFVAVYGLTLSADGKTVYAATHGRGVWTLDIS
jgi:hypothetical protein